jgi:hypothetical protein
MARATKGFGSGAGMGLAAGSAAGTVLGGVSNFRDARAQGSSMGDAARAGLSGAARGAVRGAAVGTLAGGTAGALRPALAQGAAKLPGLGAASRFGQRQIHSLTGVGDAAYVRSIGGGAADAREQLVSATKALRDAPDAAGRAKAMEGVRTARKGFQSAEKAEAAGLTSIPGYLKAMAKDPVGAVRTGVRAQWDTSGAGGKALMFGLPAAGAALEAAKDRDSMGQDRGRFERAGRLLGGAASGMLAPLSIAGDVVAGGALAAGAGAGGKFVDRSLKRLQARRGRPVQTQEPEVAGGESQAAGHIISDRAAGTAAEGVTG